MTEEELTELLNKELERGEVMVTFTPQCRIDWNLNGSNIVTVFDKAILNYDNEIIKEEFIKPTISKLKMLRRRNEIEANKCNWLKEFPNVNMRELLQKTAEERKAVLEYLKDK